jgi:hypothetical protein
MIDLCFVSYISVNHKTLISKRMRTLIDNVASPRIFVFYKKEIKFF